MPRDNPHRRPKRLYEALPATALLLVVPEIF